MTCIGVIEADLKKSPIGTRSRLGDDLRGEPVLTRTVRQIVDVRGVDHVFVVCGDDEMDCCRSMVPQDARERVTVRGTRVKNAPFRHLVRTARKWSLDGWRGGLGGVCCMDEYTRTDELALLAHEMKADAVLCAPAAAPLFDAKLADAMIEHADRTRDESRLTFVQSPPGLAGTVFRTELLIEMGQKHVPPGFVTSYKPDTPQMDLALKSCCYPASRAVRHSSGRMIADTDRAWASIGDYLTGGGPIDADRVGQWLISREESTVPSLPREVEIELTTEDQLPNALLRPRGGRVRPRGPIDLAIVERIATEMAAFDDALIVLGGFGDPLLHPRFDDVLRIIRSAGIYGVAVRTNGIALDAERIDSLIRHQVDVLNVVLDGWTAATYAAVQGADRLDAVLANIKRLTTRRNEAQSVAPLLVPELTKSNETADDMDAFFDGWIRDTGWACISGYSRYAGQMPDRAVMDMTPPTRFACRRIRHRAMVLSDGTMPVCDQDFNGLHPAGDLHRMSLADCWAGPTMTRVRERHRNGQFDGTPLCGACVEWHRP